MSNEIRRALEYIYRAGCNNVHVYTVVTANFTQANMASVCSASDDSKLCAPSNDQNQSN